MQQGDGSHQQQQEGALLPTTPSSLAAMGAIPVSHPAVSQLRVTGRMPVVTAATAAIGVVAAGQQGVLSSVSGGRPVAMSPQAVMVPTHTVSRLLSPAASLSANSVQIPATLNVLQRQLSAPGVVGLSAVSAQDLQQMLQQAQQASQQSITLQTATEALGDSSSSGRTGLSPRLARPASFPHPPVSSVSATGATIHHHGQSPARGGSAPSPHSNLQHSLLAMNVNPQQQQQQQLSAQQRRSASTAATTTVTTTAATTTTTTAVCTATTTTSGVAVVPAANIVAQSRTVLEVRAPSGQPPSLRTASGAPPRKKIRLEEKPPPNTEVAGYRKQLVELKHRQMKELKAEYFEDLTEMFFLQSGQNLIDYHTWKKRPTPQLVSFLTSGKLDSDEEEDVLQVKEINSEVKVLTNPGSNVPLATPVAISTTLPPLVSALSQQVVAPSAQPGTAGTTSTTLSSSTSGAILSSSTSSAASVSSSQLQQQLARTQDAKSPSKSQVPGLKVKTPPMSPGQRLHTRQQSLMSNVYDNIPGSSQEVIVERAKQEAQVVQRVAELRKEGLWSSKRLPRVQEPTRQKAHWDYLLEEMTWLAADFIQERKWKKAAARKVARMVSNYFKEQEQKELKAEKEEAGKLKKIASHMAKMVREFWNNIEKVVQYKQQMRLDEKKKRALDLHLNFIVDQTEKYSSWLTESLQANSSLNGSHSTSPAPSSDGGDFEPSDNSTDDEETIQKEEDDEAAGDEDSTDELEALQKEGDLPLDELLKSLPQEVLDAPAPLLPPMPEGLELDDYHDDLADNNDDAHKEDDLNKETEEKVEESGSKDGEEKSGEKEVKKERTGDSDVEFTGKGEEDQDVEDTIDEQENQEKHDYRSEIQDLQDEGEMSIEELAAKYAGAYDSDFEMPEKSSSEEEEESESESEVETESSSEEEEEAAVKEGEGEDSLGLEALMKPQQTASASASSAASAPTPQPAGSVKKEEESEVINDIAAQALSLQPKGYTLETTEVRTKVPFLLKHTLREYQHVGLDWLATMHDKHLNGILADEMGLGKTIQTIALLAHLACEKGIWGPHLIVVPTSVMLNWEMELKKWCPSFKILTYYGNQKERKMKRQGWTKTNAFHVCITSYKLVVQDHQAFRRKKWKYLILDEAQNIKNFKSQRWQMLLNFSSQRRLLLTGTPLQNSLMELWSLMHFLMPNVFQSHRDFKEWFSNPLTGMIEGSQEYNESLIKRLHKVLRPFLLRRLKNEVEKQMPQKYEHVVMCRLSKRQRFLYDDFMSQAKTRETLASGHYMSVINILMQLRKVCNHPNLFDPRPVVSPFSMDRLTYTTASSVAKILIKDPLEEVDMRTLFPNLAEMERDLPAFVAHRVKQLKTSPALIEEIDYQSDPPPPPPRGQLKPGTFPIHPPLLQSQCGRSSPVVEGRSGSPVDVVMKAAVARSNTPPSIPTPRPSTQPSATPSLSIPLSTLTSSASSSLLTSALPTASLSQVRSLSGSQTLLLTSTAARTAGGAALMVTSAPALVTTVTGISAASPLTSTLQAKVLSQSAQGSGAGSGNAMLSTQPITVQIQQTNQGTRLMIPTGQLSQLPASLFQIVQTSSGQHLVATPTPTSLSAQVSAVLPVTSTASSTVNGPSTLTTVAATGGQGLVTTAVSQLKTITALATTAATTTTTPSATPTTTPSATPTLSTTAPSSSSTVTASAKGVTRVTPVMTTGSAMSTSTSCSLPASVVSSVVSTLKSVMSPKKRSELFLDSLYEKRKRQRREKLKRISRVNEHHCSHTPVYGPDLIQTLTLTSDLCAHCHRERYWLRAGRVNCQCCHGNHNPNLPRYYWRQTSQLVELVRTPQQYMQQLHDVLDRFAFCIPTVISGGVELKVAHPDPSLVLAERRMQRGIVEHLRPVNTLLNNLSMKMSIHFPDLRLIQYDCGKLQTLDVLLRRLKTGSHRVLIFTQMTKMLDVLEAFLNYHGHRYLRLDGTTRVEQRQCLMDRFNADKRIFCFILSTRSGGVGVNLTGADTVIFYDSDWNPTMDAQAQDRCHRIGQTRDVHIYRLISEMTVEENILKKANQKRLLGDLAIEGGNFTTAFFKEQTIKDLFAQPSGLKSLTEEEKAAVKEVPAEEAMEVTEEEPPTPTPSTSTGKKVGGKDDANLVAAFEQALCKAEDESDAMAASLVKAEQKAELADFDETIPWDDKEAEARKEEEEMSRAELELAMLDKELSGIERYAVNMMETQMEDEVMEELKMAEEDIENSKKDWELTRLKALKEEEERRARLEEDEMLYTYLRDDAQVKRRLRLTKAGTVRKKPGRPRTRPQPTSSPSLSDTGSADSRPPPSASSSRTSIRSALSNLSPTRGIGGGRRRKTEEGEGVAAVVKNSPTNNAKAIKAKVADAINRKVSKGKVAPPTVKAKVTAKAATGDGAHNNGPVKAKRVRKNNKVANKALHNGDDSVDGNIVVDGGDSGGDGGEVKVDVDDSGERVKKGDVGAPKKNKKVKGKAGEGVGKAGGTASKAPRGRPVGRPSKAAKAAAAAAIAGSNSGRAILKVPAMTSGTVTTVAVAAPAPAPQPLLSLPVPITSPTRNKSPGAAVGPVISSPVTSPGNVPPPWSNPNLVIRTRRANIHSPVQMAANRSVSSTGGQVSSAQLVQRPTVGMVHSGGVVRLVSPSGPVVALHNAQGISLAGARVLGAGQQVLGGSVGVGAAQSIMAGQSIIGGSGVSVTGAHSILGGSGVSVGGTRVVASQALSGARLINASSLVFSRPQQLVSVAGSGAASAKVLTSSAQIVGGVGVGGARLLTSSQVVNAGSLQGSLVRMPDGSTAVLGQIAASGLVAAQSANTGHTLLVSPTSQHASGARAVLASNLARGATTTAIRLASPQVVGATGVRALQLGTGRLTSPVTLRGVGSVPLGVNFVKAGGSGGVQIPLVGQAGAGGVSIPIMGAHHGLALRGGQIIQTNLAQTAASPHSFVLITPRAATPITTTVTTPVTAPGTINGSAEKKGAG